jgi:hypothetical protein
MRIPVLAEDNSVQFWMKYGDAIDALRKRKIEEIYDRHNKFLGVVLCEAPATVAEEFHRGSLNNSPAAITKSECMANARVIVAREKVTSWPSEHDQNNVVISAGIAYGVYCPLFDTNVHTPNFA